MIILKKLKKSWNDFYYLRWLSWYNMSWLENTIWYFLHRFHPNHRYNIIKTDLKPGYYEWPTRFVYGAFNDFADRYPYTRNFYELDPDAQWALDRILVWWKNYDQRVDDNEERWLEKEISFDEYEENIEKLDKETIKNINILWKYRHSID